MNSPFEFLMPFYGCILIFWLSAICSCRNTEEEKKIGGGEAHGQKTLVVNPASTATPAMMTSGPRKKSVLLAGATDGATPQQVQGTVWARWRDSEQQRVCASWLARTRRSDKWWWGARGQRVVVRGRTRAGQGVMATGDRGSTAGWTCPRGTQSTIAPSSSSSSSRETVAGTGAEGAGLAPAAKVKVMGAKARSRAAAWCSQWVTVRRGCKAVDSITTTRKATPTPTPTQTNSTTHDLTAAATTTTTLTTSRETTPIWLRPLLMLLTSPLHPPYRMQGVWSNCPQNPLLKDPTLPTKDMVKVAAKHTGRSGPQARVKSGVKVTPRTGVKATTRSRPRTGSGATPPQVTVKVKVLRNGDCTTPRTPASPSWSQTRGRSNSTTLRRCTPPPHRRASPHPLSPTVQDLLGLLGWGPPSLPSSNPTLGTCTHHHTCACLFLAFPMARPHLPTTPCFTGSSPPGLAQMQMMAITKGEYCLHWVHLHWWNFLVWAWWKHSLHQAIPGRMQAVLGLVPELGQPYSETKPSKAHFHCKSSNIILEIQTGWKWKCQGR